MSTIDLTKLPIGELKALAYDYIAQKERIERDLSNINQAIANRQQAIQASTAQPTAKTEEARAVEEAEIVNKKQVKKETK